MRLTDEQTPKAAQTCVEAIEQETSCEVVFAVVPRSASYFGTSFMFGLALSTLTLVLLLFLPQPFDIRFFPVETVLAFLVGALFCHRVTLLKRLLMPKARARREVAKAARAQFFDLGISATAARGGVLIFVSALERRCELLFDVGIDQEKIHDALVMLEANLNRAVRDNDSETFFRVAETLGDILGALYPRQEDDVNELPDTLVRL